MASGLSRVTVVAPTIRVDLALPSDVSLADMLPTLLTYASADLADDPAARNGWTLSRLGGVLVDSSLTPQQLDLRDGELLYLRPFGTEAPPPVFDDVVDAVATATRGRPGRWSPATTRFVGLALAVVVLLVGAVAVLFAGPPQGVGGFVALGLAVTLTVVAAVLSRASGERRPAAAFAVVALVHAAVGGLLVLAGDRSLRELAAPHVLVAATAVALFTALASVAVGGAGPLFLGTGLVSGALLAGTAVVVLTGLRAAAVAAVLACVVYVLLPLLPMVSYRLGRLPIPSVPADRDDVRQDVEPWDSALLLERSDRADAYLAAMLTAFAVIGAGAGVLVSRSGGPGAALCVVLGAILVGRARWFAHRSQRLPLLLLGALAVAAAALAGFQSAGTTGRLVWTVAGVLVTAGICAGFGFAAGRRPASPMWGRALDVIEVLLILSVLPLAMWVADLYAWIRTVRG
ncbi:type VII secretion integral membrane protein EccD [Virgisporangium aliadipatigenens]|uniref:Type VII secretion integral membrane protein EccD n=1 Tax=Virgisporangium aliadipatigenens TaxID=741659 RepID=A0A8J3YR02_9ACTN|nr:type VII secretion integral membrane protein EccD [Virgisporangium aliadipatigenens]GIJ49007.1 type VII secretion integral membrane protein EccD [Virgisporangium aliadipatigenens]